MQNKTDSFIESCTKVISLISKDVVETAKVSLDGFKFITQEGTPNIQMPQQFQTKNLIS
tara:strand:+ start:2504 stop:2680 length:177 start_codon:yes stop_codon:yes gene_type:complete